MKIERIDNRDEKLVLIGMITDNTVCARIISKWQPDLFKNKYANLVAGWCKKYFDKYQAAPNEKIEDYFAKWGTKTKDETTIKLIERFMQGLNDEYTNDADEVNSNYTIDVAGRYFALVQMERIKQKIEDSIQSEDPTKAESIINGYSPITMGVGAGVDVLQDKLAWKSAFESNSEPVVKFTGPLGQFFDDDLTRECFVSFEGPEGRGKSFWLMEVAFRAVMARKRVLFFELGDMSQDQIMRRMGSRIAGLPTQPCTVQHPKRIKIYQPRDVDDHPYAKLATEEKVFNNGLTWQKAWEACGNLNRRTIRSKNPYWKLYSYPPDVLHCKEIRNILTDLAREGWVADVVVIDYADLLNMTYGKTEGRDQINKAWEHMRQISLAHHCLVGTATQTDAASNDAWVIRRKNFSEDKRKRAHITSGYGINQTEAEKVMQLMRLNKIKKRHGQYIEGGCVWVAGCLELANVAVRSSF